MQPSFKRYLVRLGAALAGALAVVWLYVALVQMAYVESGYAAWVAKSVMLDECRLGEVAFFGDSRLEAGVVPALLPVPASNFGLAAGTPVETRSAVRRALRCPVLPAQAVLSLSPEHFGPLSRFFWLLSLRYGFIGPGELLDTERLAGSLGDTQSLATRTPDGLSGPVRDWLYELRFPSLSFSSLVQGRIFGRWRSNQARLASVLQARGWSEYAGGEGETEKLPLAQTKLQTAEFGSALDALGERGVQTRLLIMPRSQSEPPQPEAEAAYLRYLAETAARFPGLEIVGSGIPRWPARLFADGLHLNGEGARRFTTLLARCMDGGRIQNPCDLSWREDTAAVR